jgi:hypothetical protein
MKLYEAARLIRAKNAGPFMLTVDILFENAGNYDLVVQSGLLTAAKLAEIYKLPVQSVEYYEVPDANAIKFSFPRPCAAGDFEDNDLFGGQQHAPLVELEIPG